MVSLLPLPAERKKKNKGNQRSNTLIAQLGKAQLPFNLLPARFLSIISLVNDSLSGLTFGTTGILYLIILSVASFQASIKLRSIFLSEWIAFIIALMLAYVALILIRFMTDVNFSISEILLNYIFTVIVYPFIWYPLARLIYA